MISYTDFLLRKKTRYEDFVEGLMFIFIAFQALALLKTTFEANCLSLAAAETAVKLVLENKDLVKFSGIPYFCVPCLAVFCFTGLLRGLDPGGKKGMIIFLLSWKASFPYRSFVT